MMNTAVDAAKTVSDDTKDISQASFIYLKKRGINHRFLFFFSTGGRGGIRTHGTLRYH